MMFRLRWTKFNQWNQKDIDLNFVRGETKLENRIENMLRKKCDEFPSPPQRRMTVDILLNDQERCQFLSFHVCECHLYIHCIRMILKLQNFFLCVRSRYLLAQEKVKMMGKKWLNSLSQNQKVYRMKKQNIRKTYHRWFDFRMVWSVCDAAWTSNLFCALCLVSFGLFSQALYVSMWHFQCFHP